MSGKKRLQSQAGKKISRNVTRGKSPNQSTEPITFNLSTENWLKGIKLSRENFTNKLKDEQMFIEYITILFHKVIPIIQKYGNDMIREGGTKSWRHCHPVRDGKIDLTLKIVESIHGHRFTFEKKSGPKLWQFGVVQNIRLIAIHDYTNNSLTPLFIDYHHLIHPDDHYSHPDYEKFDYCPIEHYYNVQT